MRIVAAAGLALVLAALVAKALLLHGPPASIAVPEPVHHALAHVSQARHGTRQPRVDPTLPAPLRRALARHGVVVAVLYAPRVTGDSDAVQAARKGAQEAHAGFAVLNVRNEHVATALAQKLPGSSDPSVVIVRRPGTVAVLLTGYADPQVVAQAARDARG